MNGPGIFYTVTLPNDTALPTLTTPGTLRDAVNLANKVAAVGASVAIEFDSSSWANNTVTLQQGPLEIDKAGGAITIDGANTVTISDEYADPEIFDLEYGATVAIANLTIDGSQAVTNGGVGCGINVGNFASLNLTNSTVQNIQNSQSNGIGIAIGLNGTPGTANLEGDVINNCDQTGVLYNVTSADDPATLTAGTLRDAVNVANMAAASDISVLIKFNPVTMFSNTVALQQGPLEIDGAGGVITIDGGNAITVGDQNSDAEIFDLENGAAVSIVNLTIDGSLAYLNSGGVSCGINVDNASSLTLSDSTVQNITNTPETAVATNVGATEGGSTLTLTGDTMSNNDVGISLDSATATVTGNTITGNDTGIVVLDDYSASPTVLVNFNRIVSNTFGVDDEMSSPMDASNNWWGSNTGPSSSDIIGSVRALSRHLPISS